MSVASLPPVRSRIAHALAVGAAALLYAVVTQAWWVGVVVGAVAAASVARFPRLVLPALPEVALTSGAAALLAIFLPVSWLQDPAGVALSELSARSAVGPLLLVVLRLLIASPTGGKGLNLMLLIASAVACGQTDGGWRYPLLAAVLLVAIAADLLQDRHGGPTLAGLRDRPLRPWLAAVFVGACATVACAALLPVLHGRVIRAFYDLERRGSTSGFSDDILFGGAADITESDELVLRVHGPQPSHLRGVVFSRYRNGRWVPGEADPGKPLLLHTHAPESATRVQAEKPGPRYFVPLEASAVATPSALVLADRMGTLRAPNGAAAYTIWFTLDSPVGHVPQPPTDEDTEVPAPVRDGIAALAAEWTKDESTHAGKLASIERHLRRDFKYALRHERATRADPIVDFLTRNRVGHCEYFASAMALMARSLGIPARVASGFRVHERNPVGGFHVVRARDAHAWVEAWVDGAWVTFDPTPPNALASERQGATPWVRAVWDYWTDRWENIDGAQVRLAAFLITAVLAGAAALTLWLRRWYRARRRVGAGQVEETLPSVGRMLDVLERRGMARPAAETLEAYSMRLRDAGAEELSRAAEILEGYARYSYGGTGSRAEIEGVTTAWLRRNR